MTSNSYAMMQRNTLSGRSLEREVFSRVTARLLKAKENKMAHASPIMDAVQENMKLWLTLAVDLANPDNHCSAELKAGLISLASFVESHSKQVILGKAQIDVLIEINRNIIDGLSRESTKAA